MGFGASKAAADPLAGLVPPPHPDPEPQGRVGIKSMEPGVSGVLKRCQRRKFSYTLGGLLESSSGTAAGKVLPLKEGPAQRLFMGSLLAGDTLQAS
ncbi:Hypothetical predicted protein [Marmota monax]|uniref:Uncharacterized protein n=1 Tax=Marmota monax TaxID=9995 RepID=A0A5E4B3E8_MARMO|nr:hypothetical protein GHT09_014043 [Marmota monax]VTJ64208.1 Hypothetical predicted protein [Marmota monax]